MSVSDTRSQTISILIPVYNREAYIAECISSALGQIYDDFEVIVVDNASTDSTWHIVQQFTSQDSRVRAFRNANNIGPVRNWKRCVAEARGELCKFLFSDDTLEPDCLREMAAQLASPEIGFAYSSVFVGENQKQSQIVYALERSKYLSSEIFIQLLLDDKAPISPGAMLFRKRDLEQNLIDNIDTTLPRDFSGHGAGPDVLLSLLTAKNYKFVAHICNPLVFFRIHPDSITIINKDSEIERAYLSALSYFLKTSNLQKQWMRYLARNWAGQVKRDHKWVGQKRFLVEHEGSGRLTERLALCGSVLAWIVERLGRTIISHRGGGA